MSSTRPPSGGSQLPTADAGCASRFGFPAALGTNTQVPIPKTPKSPSRPPCECPHRVNGGLRARWRKSRVVSRCCTEVGPTTPMHQSTTNIVVGAKSTHETRPSPNATKQTFLSPLHPLVSKGLGHFRPNSKGGPAAGEHTHFPLRGGWVGLGQGTKREGESVWHALG